MRKIRTITIIGANGTMGAQCAGLFAGFGKAKVYMLSRNLEKSKEGIEKAVRTIKTDTIRKRLIPGSYENDLDKSLFSSDLIFETLPEDYFLKKELYRKITGKVRPRTIISTCSSGLSIEELSKTFDKSERPYFFGAHFFNPSYKMILCELVSHKGSDHKVKMELAQYLNRVLLRAVVFTKDTPGYVANRIGFQLMNEVAQFSEKYKNIGGISLLDKLIGRYTGRVMPPLATLDFVGLDVYKAIVDNLYDNTHDHARQTFKLPSYIEKLVSEKRLGKKSGEGFFKYVKSLNGKNKVFVYNISKDTYEPYKEIRISFVEEAKHKNFSGDYLVAMRVIKEAKGFEADIVRYFLSRYISYSLSLVGEVVDSKEMVDTAMAYGFNWVPPSALVDFLGGVKAAISLIESAKLPVPSALSLEKNGKNFYRLQGHLDARSFLRN